MAMAKKVNSVTSYIHTNRNFLLLVSAGAVILILSLYFFVPKAPPPVLSEAQNENIDIALKAFQGEGSVKCVIKSGDAPGTAYIKNGNVRFISSSPKTAKIGNAILKGNMGYVWADGAKEGMKADTDNPLVQAYLSVDKIKEQIDKSNPTCATAVINDSLFVPPSSVVFSDVLKMFLK